MLMIAQVCMAITGLVALLRGRMRWWKSKVVVGVPARLLGLLGLIPIPLAALVGTLYIAANNTDIWDLDAVQDSAQENRGTLTLIEGLCLVVVAAIQFTVAARLAVPRVEIDGRGGRPAA